VGRGVNSRSRTHKHWGNRRDLKIDTVQKGDKISTSGSTFIHPGDVLSPEWNTNVVNSSFSAKAGEQSHVDDPPFAEEVTRWKYAAAVMDLVVGTKILSVLRPQRAQLTIQSFLMQ
jgi:hypothetical protein